MENNKYYTPTIEEFHVGFEYQFNHKNKGWIDLKFGDTDDWSILEIDMEIENNEIRVKYLDKEDIESLGWIYEKALEDEYHIFFKKGTMLLEFSESFRTLRIYYIISYIDDIFEVKEEHTLFLGTIKNKSELKRLMKQLGTYEQYNK